MIDFITFTSADVVLGIGILGLYAYNYRIELQNRAGRAELFKKIDSLMKRVLCLQTLHLQHHPEDKGIVEEVCGEMVPA